MQAKYVSSIFQGENIFSIHKKTKSSAYKIYPYFTLDPITSNQNWFCDGTIIMTSLEMMIVDSFENRIRENSYEKMGLECKGALE